MNHELFFGSFDELNIPSTLLQGLKDLGYEKPTLIQWEVFPLIMQGANLLAQSQTGSGKTAAFCLPILSQLTPHQKGPKVLVLAPTRELCKQIAQECSKLAQHHGVIVAALYGGASMEAQIAQLKTHPQVLIATPGRLKDLIERGFVRLETIEHCVLDEADEMLSMGFWEDILWIFSRLPKQKQTLLFSATVPQAIESAIETFAPGAHRIDLSHMQEKPQIRHIIHVEDEHTSKQKNLLYALEQHQPSMAIVFCNRKEDTEFLERYLNRFGFQAKALNGDLSQPTRERILQSLKTGTTRFLIATDLAARGIDIPAVSHVFHYELPDNPEIYVHRCGRTGRIGKTGTAISLVRGKDLPLLEALKTQYQQQFETHTFLPESEIAKFQADRMATQLFEHFAETEISQLLPIAQHLFERPDVKPLLAYLLKDHLATLEKPVEPKMEPVRKQPQRDRPVQRKPVSLNEASEEKKAPRLSEQEYVRLYITLGREDGIHTLTELMQYISNTCGIDLGAFTGGGQLRDHSSHIEVEGKEASLIVNALHQKARPTPNHSKGNRITCEVSP